MAYFKSISISTFLWCISHGLVVGQGQTGNQSIDGQAFTSKLDQQCSSWLGDLETCMAKPNMTARNVAGINYYYCMTDNLIEFYTGKPQEDIFNHTRRFALPHNFTFEKQCTYPHINPILYDVCGKEPLKGFSDNRYCNTTGNFTEVQCKAHAYDLYACSSIATEQYVRCSGRYPNKGSANDTESAANANKTLDCVRENYSRYRWPVNNYVLQSGESCETPKRVLLLLMKSNIIAFFSALLLNVTFLKYVIGRRQKWDELKRKDVKVSFLRMIITTGTQLAVPILVGYILDKQGLLWQTSIWYQVFIWALRPRSAFLVGLLGIAHPMWMETALDEMVADLLFSLVGGAFAILTLIGYDKAIGTAGIIAYYLAGCGLVLTSTLFVFITILGVVVDIKQFCYFLAGIFLAIWEIIVIIVNLYKKIRKQKDRLEPFMVSASELSFHYYLMLAGGCLLFVGGWMVWSTMLTMAGDLYCPADLKQVEAVLFVYPIALNLVRGLISMV